MQLFVNKRLSVLLYHRVFKILNMDRSIKNRTYERQICTIYGILTLAYKEAVLII